LNHFLKNSEKRGLPRFIESFEEKKETLLIFELMDGDVNDKQVSLDALPVLLEDVARALASLHLRGFVHFDIRTGIFLNRTFLTFR
jgi:tRNA A-37 threonylcarbamoyl transferase component Bud32